jgi:protoporphyrinogen oxidase
MPDSSYDVVVIGAGPAGVSAAWRLSHDSQLRVCIIEADPVHVGGISRTHEYQGFLFDIGGHRFFSKSQEIEQLWSEMLPEDLLVRRRKSRIYYRGKFFDYPLQPIQAFIGLGPVESPRCVASYLLARVRPIRNARTFREWVSNQFGKRLFGIFFKTYTEKVWGMSCDELSADWAAQRIKGLSLWVAIRDGVRRVLRFNASRDAAPALAPKTLIEQFRYPKKGPGMLWQAATQRLRDRGVTLLMGHRATAFRHDVSSSEWAVDVDTGAGVRQTVRAKHVICSAPMREVVQAVEPVPRSSTDAARLRYRDFLTVALILRQRAGLFDDNWIYIHEPSVKVGRIQNFGAWSPDMVPTPDHACLGMEYFCFEGDDLWGMDDQTLVELAKKELMHLKLASSDEVVDGCVVRQPKAYPVYDDHYAGVVGSIRSEFSTRYPGFHFVGRNGMHRYDNQDHAMMTGILTAANIIAGREVYDVWRVNDDAEYIEALPQDRRAALDNVRLVPERVRG